MRRRALLATSRGGGDLPPESTEFGFPLYINFTGQPVENDYYLNYGAKSGTIIESLWRWVREEIGAGIGGNDGYYDPEQYPIYVNGVPILYIEGAVGLYYFYSEDYKMEMTLSMDSAYLIIYK